MKINYTLAQVFLSIILIVAIYYLSIWTYWAWTETTFDERVDKFLSIVCWLLLLLIYLGPFEGSKHFTKKRTINLNFKK